jgi:hypothetical protein
MAMRLERRLGTILAVALWVLPSIWLGLFDAACARADDPIAIGVIQYNVKQGRYKNQNGWDEGLGSLQKEVDLIVKKVKDKSNPVPVQFISLVQAKGRPISDDLPQWHTVKGGCAGDGGYVEGVQIAYSPDWELVKQSGNPLVDSFDSDNCFSTGRPYNLAYFQQTANPKFKVLFVVIHPGHCYDYYDDPTLPKLTGCIKREHEPLFPDPFPLDDQAVAATGVASKADLKDINVLIAGDTNELGSPGQNPPSCGPFPGTPLGYETVFPNFGPLSVAELRIPRSECSTDSTNATCCSNPPEFTYAFDRIVINHAVKASPPVESIIDKPNYPLFGGSEEHKAIYGVVTFPAPQ